MGIAVLADYHLAAIVAQFRRWTPEAPVSFWGEIEQSLIPGGRLYEYALAYPYLKNTHKEFLLLVLATLQACKYLKTHQSWSTPKAPLSIPISTLALLISDLIWIKKDIKWLYDLFQGSNMKSFLKIF